MILWRKFAWIQEISGAVLLCTDVINFWMSASPVGTYWALTLMPGCSSSNFAISSFNAGTVEETQLCQKVMVIFSPPASLFPPHPARMKVNSATRRETQRQILCIVFTL